MEGCRKSEEWYRGLGLPSWSTSPLPFFLPDHEELARLLALPLVTSSASDQTSVFFVCGPLSNRTQPVAFCPTHLCQKQAHDFAKLFP